MSQELCPDVEMGLFEPAVLAAGINQLFKLPQKRPRGQPLSLCLCCLPTRPVGAVYDQRHVERVARRLERDPEGHGRA